MGRMKDFLMDKVAEFATLNGYSEEEVYRNDALYQRAVEYADKKLKEGKHGKGNSVTA